MWDQISGYAIVFGVIGLVIGGVLTAIGLVIMWLREKPAPVQPDILTTRPQKEMSKFDISVVEGLMRLEKEFNESAKEATLANNRYPRKEDYK